MAELPGAGVRAPDASEPAPPSADAVRYARLTGGLGIAFAGLLVAGLVLVHRSPGLGVSDATVTSFYSDGGKTILVTVGLYLVPFAGIAFLWHMTTLRLLVRELTPSPSAIPLGLNVVSGGLFVGLLFCGTAAAGAVALVADLTTSPLPSADVARMLTGVGYAMVFVYSVRAAGMYVITASTLLLRTGLLPRWIGILSYVMAAAMLVTTTFNPAALLVFPGWVALVSVIILVRAGRPGAAGSRRGGT